jgi:hypothetical protein
MLDGAAIAGLAEADGEFRIASRGWSATVELAVDQERVAIRFEGGRAVPAAGGAPDVTIAAPRAAWAEMLRPVPRPFYHDLMAARSHEGVVVDSPDPEQHLMAYYPALRRLLELIRLSVNQEVR